MLLNGNRKRQKEIFPSPFPYTDSLSLSIFHPNKQSSVNLVQKTQTKRINQSVVLWAAQSRLNVVLTTQFANYLSTSTDVQQWAKSIGYLWTQENHVFPGLASKTKSFWKSFIQHYFQSHCCGWAPFKTYFGQFYFYHIQVKFPILMGQNFPSQPCLSTPNTLYSNSPPDIYQITSSWKYLKQLPSKMSPTFWYPHSPIIEFLHMWQGQPFWPIEQDNGISLLRFIVEYL